jgi:hypothetical protein
MPSKARIMFEVVKVVIKGEMPRNCLSCRFRHSIVTYNVTKQPHHRIECRLAHLNANTVPVLSVRPDWCPLVLDIEDISHDT